MTTLLPMDARFIYAGLLICLTFIGAGLWHLNKCRRGE